MSHERERPSTTHDTDDDFSMDCPSCGWEIAAGSTHVGCPADTHTPPPQ